MAFGFLSFVAAPLGRTHSLLSGIREESAPTLRCRGTRAAGVPLAKLSHQPRRIVLGAQRAVKPPKTMPEFRDRPLQNFRPNSFAIQGGIASQTAHNPATSRQWKFDGKFRSETIFRRKFPSRRGNFLSQGTAEGGPAGRSGLSASLNTFFQLHMNLSV